MSCIHDACQQDMLRVIRGQNITLGRLRQRIRGRQPLVARILGASLGARCRAANQFTE